MVASKKRGLAILNFRESNKRLLIILIFFTAALFAVPIRLFYIQVVEHEFYKTKSIDQRTRIIILAADRGDIVDREGNILVTSIDTYSIFAIPRKIEGKEYVAGKLSGILGVTKYSVLNKLYKDKPFVWIKRKVSKALGEKVKAAKLDGIGALVEKKRVYPKGSLASQILGFVGVDNQGLSGIELGFDRYLRGVEGKLITESDPSGHELVGAAPREIQSPTDGLKLVLSVDEVVQYISERELEAALKKHNAKSGTIIVMDVSSGDILAIASKPDFDPNKYLKFPARFWGSRAILDVYEPGSTFKLITIAAALEEDLFDLSQRMHCPEYIKIGGKTIRNAHRLKIEEKDATLTDILTFSINTGAVKVAMELGPPRFYDYIQAFGFGQRTDIGIPGETRGILRDVDSWSKSDIATISFGQGIAVTPLQLISAVATIANDGIKLKPILVKRIESIDGNFVKIFPKEEGDRVISQKAASELKQMMVDVVERGTGKLARIAGFKVGGKTGTAQKVRKGGRGYWPGHYIASFVGIAPASRPKIAILVVIDDPQDVHWGEKVAAPVFARVGEETLRYLNVAPDDVAALSNVGQGFSLAD